MSKKEELEKKKKIQKLQERQKEVENETGKYQVRQLSKVTERRDANLEKSIASRYKNDFNPQKVVPEGGPQPGVTGKGTFSLYAKNKKKKKDEK